MRSGDQDWPKAERLFTEAIRSAPNRAWPYKWLGMTYAAQEKYELSEPPFRRACEIDPKEPDVCYYWGRTLFSLSRFDAALRAYEKDVEAVAWQDAARHGAGARGAEPGRGGGEACTARPIRAGDKQAAIEYEKFRRKRPRAGVASPEIQFAAADLPGHRSQRRHGPEAADRDDDCRRGGARLRWRRVAGYLHL